MNSNKTYIAFGTIGQADAVCGKMEPFHLIEHWNGMHPGHMHFLNFQDLASPFTHEDLFGLTQKRRMIDTMADADNLLVPVSPLLDADDPILNWQISQAVNGFRLPVVIAYAGLQKIEEEDIRKHLGWLPAKIRKYMSRDSARMAHIPLTYDKLERALTTYSKQTGSFPWCSTTIF